MARKSFTSDLEARNEATPAAAAIADYEPQQRGRRKKKETKTRRVNLIVKPSVYAAISELAEEEGRSLNDYINRLMERDIWESRR